MNDRQRFDILFELVQIGPVIAHGDLFDEPENVGKALKMMPGIQGFFGTSSIERLPTERAIRGWVEVFKGLG